MLNTGLCSYQFTLAVRVVLLGLVCCSQVGKECVVREWTVLSRISTRGTNEAVTLGHSDMDSVCTVYSHTNNDHDFDHSELMCLDVL